MRMLRRAVIVVGLSLYSTIILFAQAPGQNINMVSGTIWPAGDPYLQRQNEPSVAVSSRNAEHLLGGANDYRTVDIPNPQAPNILGDAWLGVYSSLDGGETWKSTLLPGYPQDTSAVGVASPLHSFTVATDPTVRAGTHGMFYYSGLVFNRGTGMPSGVFVATFQDQNNKGNGDAAILMKNSNGTVHGNSFLYIGANLVDSGTSGQFLDKPWIAVDIPRPGRMATCKINGQTFNSGYVYVVFTQFNGSQNNPSSKIKVVTSTNCGTSWSQPQVLSQSQKLAQGTVAAIDPTTGNVSVAWRQIASSNGSQPDAIQYAVSTDGGNSFSVVPPVFTFAAPTASNPYPPGSVFDQPQANTTTFRSLDVPALAVDASGRVWLAFSERFNGPTAGTYGSRIMITTLAKGTSKWTMPYIADATAPTTSYGHQFMPSLTFAYGKLMLAWFDSRRDNLENVLACIPPKAPANGTCTDLSQLTPQDQPIPGSMISSPANVFTPTISDPNSGIRHTIDVFGAMIDPSAGPAPFTGFQISQYAYWVNGADNNQIEQGFFNPPNLPMFVQGTTPFIGDYIDIAAQTVMPSGNSWVFNIQGKDSTGATNAPDFHVTWTDNRDVVPPPVVNGTQNWTIYYPPNSDTSSTSTYSGSGDACPTCSTTQPACTTVKADDGTMSAYSGDRNQNVYTSRVTSGLVVRFRENAKQLSSSIPRSFSLLVRNTLSPLSTTPPGATSYYRIMLGVTAANQAPTCNLAGGGTATLPGGLCYLDVAINPKTTLTQSLTISNSANANASVNVLVAQTNCVPKVNVSTGPVSCSNQPGPTGLQSLAVINGDATNPSLANPDFVTADNSNPDVSAPYAQVPIVAGEEYNPTVDAPPDASDGIFTPQIGTPTINTPKIISISNNTPKIATPTVFTPQINTPKIASVQVVNPTIVDTINTPKINTPKINTPKIVTPDIFTPQITDLSDTSNPVTDYTWRVTNKGNSSGSYNTTELAKSAQSLGVSCCPASCSANPNSCTVTATNPAGPNCSVCQLIQHKVYESPTSNRDATTGNPTCDLNVQQETITEANIPSPAFSTGGGAISPSDPTSTLSLSPGEANRVTLRVVKPGPSNPVVSSFKTFANSYAANNINGQSSAAGSLTVTTAALPVAVVGQSYTGTALSSIGGFGATFWTTFDPTNPNGPAPVIPPPSTPANLPVTPLTLSPSGQISTGVVTATPDPYIISVQVQDSATTNNASTPALDVQQLELDVNQFAISNVNVAITNEVGSTGYMKAGDVATVSITVSSTGPATATNVAPTLTVNAIPAGTPPGPTPALQCTGPNPASATITATGTQRFNFSCAANSGNGYVTFTGNATGHYVNAAADVLATAIPVSEPATNPSGVPPNVIVDTIAPLLTFGSPVTAQSAPGWYNTAVIIPYGTSDNLSGVKSAAPSPPANATGTDAHGNGSMTLTTEGELVTGTMIVTDYALNQAPYSSTGVNIDRTPPTISGVASPAANANGWNNMPVTVTFTCNDPNPLNGPAGQQSELASCTAPVLLNNEGRNQNAPGTATDRAANSTQTSVGPINIDKTPPVVVITSPVAGTAYINNHPIAANYNCSDSLSGLASCVGSSLPVGPVASGNTFTEITPGLYNFGVLGADFADNQSPAAVAFTSVYYTFLGFQLPLAGAAGPAPSSGPPPMPTSSGTFVQGATIPILWTLASPAHTLSPGPVTDLTTMTSLNAYPYGNSTCTGAAPTTNPIQLSPATSPNSFAYDSTNQRFQFLWNTNATTPTGCYYLLITFNDLSSYATNVIISAVGSSNALAFDGTSGNSVDGSNSNLPQGNSPRTIEAWVNPSATANATVFNYGTSGTANEGFGLAYFNQHVYLIGETNDVVGSITIPTGQWTHLAISYDGNAASLYVNGALDTGTVQSGTGNNFATTGSNWRIGDKVATATPQQPFVGRIDEVKVWNTARTGAQIVSDMTGELCVGQTGLVAYYKFNEGTASGSNAGVTALLDVSSSQANGTLAHFVLTGSTSNWVAGAAPVIADQLTITIAPSNPTLSLSVSRTQQFTASGSCTDGSTPSLTPTWSSSAPAVATIDNTGLATAAATGSTTVTSASGDASGSTTLTVTQ